MSNLAVYTEDEMKLRYKAVQTDFGTLQRMSKALFASGYFTDVKSEAQAIVKVMAGAELGIPPFAAMTGIHIIKGKPQLGANLIASMIKNDPRYDYRILKIDENECSVKFLERGDPLGISTFTAADAKLAGTQNMGKFPRNMLFARAMSNGAKWFTPGIFGGMPVYVEGELGGDTAVYDDPDFIEGEIVPDDGKMNSEFSDAQLDEPAPEQEPPSAKQIKQFHATGRELYGDEWVGKRVAIVRHVSHNRTTSSKDLTAHEMARLIDGMADKISITEQPVAPHPSDR